MGWGSAAVTNGTPLDSCHGSKEPSGPGSDRHAPTRPAKNGRLRGRFLWRKGGDSNPRYSCPYAAFRVRCFQPLSHLSNLLELLAVVAIGNSENFRDATEIATERRCFRTRDALIARPRSASSRSAASCCIVPATWLQRS